jgi:hypothetical protein
MSVVWDDPEDCVMLDVARTFELLLVAVGICNWVEAPYGVAWASETGFEWRRVLETEPGTRLSGVSTNGGTGGVLIVGDRDDYTPLLWTGDIWNGFEETELPTSSGFGSAEHVAWDGYRYLAVGYEYPDASTRGHRPAAWLNRSDGSGWRSIVVPDGVEYLPGVAGEETMNESAFTVLGLTSDARAFTYQVGDDESWLPTEIPRRRHGNLLELIDDHTALGAGDLWTERDGEWHRQSIDVQIDPSAGVRLEGGFMVTGYPTPKSYRPLMVLVSANGRDWREQDYEINRMDAGIFALELFTYGVVGVGDAVYMGPGSTASYDL